MARGDQTLRQWKILTRIMSSSRYGVTQKQLLEAIQELEPGGKEKRTLQRDLQALESAGFSIDRSRRTEDGEALYKPIKTFQEIPPILPTVEELVALAVARSLLSMYEGTPFKEDLDSFWQKIQPIFKREARESLEDALAMFGTLDRPAVDYEQYKPLVRELNDAIKKRSQLTMVYYSQRQGKDADYTIDPIKFITYERVLFLAAYVYNYKEVRHFSLNKIKKLTPTGMVFPRRTYSLKELKRYAFGMIGEDPFELKVRFDKEIADGIKQKLIHPTQKFKSLSNGDLVVTIKAGGWDEMKAWILSYSCQAEVLKPDAMRAEIREELVKALSNY